MFGREDNAALDTGFLHAGKHRGKIDNEFRGGVGYDRQIRIVALGHRIVEFDTPCFSLVKTSVDWLRINNY